MSETIVIRDPRKGFYAYVDQTFDHIPGRKTIRVKPLKRIYVPKYKAFYIDRKTSYSVHYDPSLKQANPLGLERLQKGQRVFCAYTRRISKTKSSVALMYDPHSK